EVKIPYFPNWHVTGATGPYEVSPNLMAVVPTSHTVTLSYGSSPANHIGDIGTVVGVVGLGALVYFKPANVGQDPAEPVAPAIPSGPTAPSAESTADGQTEGDEESGGPPVGEATDDGKNPPHE
ncbi:MAG TPA: hypothetical protein VGP46_08825, partial [Acidimicrobiales bacterium]|nr:hypothetical protein [Acidimicrobiales bacterium]